MCTLIWVHVFVCICYIVNAYVIVKIVDVDVYVIVNFCMSHVSHSLSLFRILTIRDKHSQWGADLPSREILYFVGHLFLDI
mgnify:CR=1 FL=1